MDGMDKYYILQWLFFIVGAGVLSVAWRFQPKPKQEDQMEPKRAELIDAELAALVEAVAARADGRRPDVEGLYEYVAWNWPTLWTRFNGPERYMKSEEG